MNTSASTASIAFQGFGGVLGVSSSASNNSLGFGPSISGLDASDAIVFFNATASNSSATSASYSGGVPTLLNGTTAVARFNLAGNYQGDTFYVLNMGVAAQIGIVSGSEVAPAGTLAADEYVWNGAIYGSWDAAANWSDSSVGPGPAALAPGANDRVTITQTAVPGNFINGIGYPGAAVAITGIGNSASLTIDDAVRLAGQFTTGELVMASETGFGNLSLSQGASLLVSGDVTNASNGQVGSIFSFYQIDGATFTVNDAFDEANAEFVASNGAALHNGNLAVPHVLWAGDQKR